MSEIQDLVSRIWENLLARPSGPLAFRFLIWPGVATKVAGRDGTKDAYRALAILLDHPEKSEGASQRVREGAAAAAKIMILAVGLDTAYQYIEFKSFYRNEVLIVVIVLAFIPDLVVRGPAARIARSWSFARLPASKREKP
jgi:hypothetical protein